MAGDLEDLDGDDDGLVDDARADDDADDDHE